MKITRRLLLKISPFLFLGTSRSSRACAETPLPFGEKYPNLDSLTTGEWWSKGTLAAAPNENKNAKGKTKGAGGPPPPPTMDVPRDQVVCFAYYT